MQMPTLSYDMDEQLKPAHKKIDIVYHPKVKRYVRLLGTMWAIQGIQMLRSEKL